MEGSVGEDETASSRRAASELEGRQHLNGYEFHSTTVHFRPLPRRRRPSAPPVCEGAWKLGVTAGEEVVQCRSRNCRTVGIDCRPCRFFHRAACGGRAGGGKENLGSKKQDGPFCCKILSAEDKDNGKDPQCTYCHHPFPDDDDRINQFVIHRPNQRTRRRRWYQENPSLREDGGVVNQEAELSSPASSPQTPTKSRRRGRGRRSLPNSSASLQPGAIFQIVAGGSRSGAWRSSRSTMRALSWTCKVDMCSCSRCWTVARVATVGRFTRTLSEVRPHA